MTLRELRKCAARWQEALNLREWKIRVDWGTGDESPESGPVVGCCQWNAEELQAKIHITRGSVSQEETLVHEMLHIVYQGHLEAVPEEYDVHLERALNRTAAALVQAAKQ